MKKAIIIVLCLIFSIPSKSQSNEGKSKADFIKKGFVDIGFSYLLLHPSEYNNMHFLGISLGGGFYTTPKTRLGFELGIQGMLNKGEQIGTFEYSKQINQGTITYHDDGVISREFTAVPILVTWAYEWNIGKSTWLWFGPTIGLTPLSAINTYDPHPTEGKVDKNRETKAAFNYGGNIGLAIKIIEHCAVNVGYKFLGNTKVTFDDKEFNNTGHQMNLTFHVFF